MSAFVVGADTINRVVYGLSYIDAAPSDPNEFGRAMLALNIAAVRQRYPTDHDDMLPSGVYHYREPAPVKGCASDIASWKALECLLYQCDEGNIPDQPLYQTLNGYRERLGTLVLRSRPASRAADVWDLPEIERAPWGD